MNQLGRNSAELARFSIRSVLLLTAVVAVFFACCSAVVRNEQRRRAESDRRDEVNAQVKASIVREAEAIRAKLGRAPEDQAELEDLLGKPLPAFLHEYGESEIGYRKTGVNSFHLWYSYWDPWYYDSNTPQAGWVCAE
jgi:hypothetical protein